MAEGQAEAVIEGLDIFIKMSPTYEMFNLTGDSFVTFHRASLDSIHGFHAFRIEFALVVHLLNGKCQVLIRLGI